MSSPHCQMPVSLDDLLWIAPVSKGEWDIPKAVKVLMTSGEQLKVIDNENHISWISKSSVIKTLHPTSLNHVEDMVCLGELKDFTILHNLHMRYNRNIVYTYIGMMLVAINPYKELAIYGKADMKKYRGKRLGALPAHIYAVGSQSYGNMRQWATNQCVVISGESGAGKTESTKLLLNFLTELSGQNSNIEQQLLLSTPVLEAFGNAKTVRNDNSSRFGKYIVISYSEEGTIVGACIQPYLLEKSRITGVGPGNRNYHIFYSLLAGLSSRNKTKLGLEKADSYICLAAGGTLESDAQNEKQEFQDLCNALKVLKISDDEMWGMFKLLATILHLCNLKLVQNQSDNSDSVTILSTTTLGHIQTLLQVENQVLWNTLTKKTLQAENDTVISNLSTTQAEVQKSAFARAVYHRLFIHIVDRINKAIFKHNQTNNLSIGILDIFGFENFDNNSFEQLCINYANEHLQQFFVRHIFKLEQEEYNREQIVWSPIPYDDNEKILSLLGGDRINIFSTIDDLARLPSGTDTALIMKCNKNYEKNPFYLKAKSDIALKFGIRHYAGIVIYSVDGFLEKNRNSVGGDWLELVRGAGHALLRTLFAKELARPQLTQGKPQTVMSQYRTSLEALMVALGQCQPFFIRCIKPNDFKQPNMFDQSFCCRQLHHSGLMDTAKIRCMGFPIRLCYLDFVYRYRILLPGIPATSKVVDLKEATRRICSAFLSGEEQQLGVSKVFLKHHHSSLLELERDRLLDKNVTLLQKHMRAWILRKRFLQLKEAALTFQKHRRGLKPRQQYVVIRQGYLRLQAVISARYVRHSFIKFRSTIIGFQAWCRGYIVRKEKESLKKRIKEITGVNEANAVSLEKWITSIFEAAIEGSEDIVLSSEQLSKSENKKSGFISSETCNIIPLRISESDIDDGADTQLSFSQFAAANFHGNISYQFSKLILQQSLLDLPLPADQVAAQALWVTILRFMGDLPESQLAHSTTSSSIMIILSSSLSRNTTNSKEYCRALELLKKDNTITKMKGKLVNLTLAHKNKLKKEITQGKVEGNMLKNSYSQWLDDTKSNLLQKLHFIIGHGILRPELRDEIYCQICKQLSGNPSAASQARGWALMALCVGCFAPSSHLAPYLRSFLSLGPSRFYNYRLQRTLQNGTRSQPPSWHELNAIRNQKNLTLAVRLADGSTQLLEADSAITAHEVCSRLCQHLGLSDHFGFSLFITVFGEMIRLEAGGRHVMDAVSQCEQDAQERGVAERDTPWQLLFRKEMFAPWQGLITPDPVANDLIFCQVVRGVRTGEYRLTDDSEIALLASQQYYIEHGPHLISDSFRHQLVQYIPSRQFKLAGSSHWEKLVTDTFSKCSFVKDRTPASMVKAEVVNFAKSKWPLLFSKYYEALQLSGPDVGATNIIFAVNSTGVSLVSNSERVLLHLSYIEIHSIRVLAQRPEKELQLVTVQGYEFVYQCICAEVVTDLVQWIMDSLKEVSKYFIAVQDYSPPGGGGLLNMKRGDLIALEEGERGGEWLTGYNVLSGDWGEFPASSVRVLPTILQPPLHIVAYFNKEGALDGTLRAKAIQKLLPMENNHTLEQFANKNFRPAVGTENVWCHSAQPLRLPLHHSLQSHPLKDTAVTGFMAVLKYMGDLPASQQADLTEIIFQGPMEHELLRNELYCQLMKQLTHNGNEVSEERGWELMCLAAGSFTPSSEVLKELRLFLFSRSVPLAQDSLVRLEQTLCHGNRKHPPHWSEVQAMQQRVPITHSVSYPDHSDQRFEVNSTTRIGDLVDQIGDRLNFKSTEGFSLVVAMKDKTVALANEEYLFDAIQEICSWVASDTSTGKKKGHPNRFIYELMFMRKVWLTMVPGKDRMADVVCHFAQECPKYILGYQKCSKSDAAVLGSLIFRAEYGDNKLHLVDDSKKLLSKLVPAYHLKLCSNKEWKKIIGEVYKKHSGMTSEEAKISYLKFVFPWATFGSSFFDVRLKTEQRQFKENSTIAINKNGIFIIDRETRELLALYPFTELTSWNHTQTTFTLRVGSITLMCDTSLGYKMDDLISSYTSLITPLSTTM